MIGTLLVPFTGTFDGNHHSVANFRYSRYVDHAGFFGVAREATIKRQSERADGLGFVNWWTGRGCDNGTLYLSYDAAVDELYLGYVGYGPANAWRTVTGVLKDRWAGGPVYVVLAGASDGMEIKPGEAWLDNFTVDTGTILE